MNRSRDSLGRNGLRRAVNGCCSLAAQAAESQRNCSKFRRCEQRAETLEECRSRSWRSAAGRHLDLLQGPPPGGSQHQAARQPVEPGGERATQSIRCALRHRSPDNQQNAVDRDVGGAERQQLRSDWLPSTGSAAARGSGRWRSSGSGSARAVSRRRHRPLPDGQIEVAPHQEWTIR